MTGLVLKHRMRKLKYLEISSMKTLLASCIGLFLLSNVALAQSHEEQVELRIQAAALAQIANGDAPAATQGHKFLGFNLDALNPLNLIKKLQDQVASIKDTLLSTFDENGNGKIDQGQEFENFKIGTKAIIMLVADTNQSGKIDLEDIGVLTKLAFTKIQEQTLTKICPSVYKQVEFTGSFMFARPVLAQLNKICLAKDAAE